MSPDRIKKVLPFAIAFADGKTIQYKNNLGEWKDSLSLDFSDNPDQYRIKPELHDFLWAVQQVRDETGYTCRDSNPEFVLTKRNGSLSMHAYKNYHLRDISIEDALATDWRFHDNGE